MPWLKVITKKNHTRFLNELAKSNRVYSGVETSENIDKSFNRQKTRERKTANFIFTDDSKAFVILMSFVQVNSDLGKILVAIPSGDYTESDLPFIAKTMIRKYRNFFDRLGIKKVVGSPLGDYSENKSDAKGILLNKLYQEILPEFMHEFQKNELEKASNNKTIRKTYLERKEAQKKNDEQFINPKMRG